MKVRWTLAVWNSNEQCYSFLVGIEIGHQTHPDDHFKCSVPPPSIYKTAIWPPLSSTTGSNKCQSTPVWSEHNLPFFFSAFPSIQAWCCFTPGKWSNNNREREVRGPQVKRVLGSNSWAVFSAGPTGWRVYWDSISGCGERFQCSPSSICLTLHQDQWKLSLS